MIDEHKRRLDEDGYVVLEGVMGGRLLDELRTRILELFEEEGEQAGSEFAPDQQAAHPPGASRTRDPRAPSKGRRSVLARRLERWPEA